MGLGLFDTYSVIDGIESAYVAEVLTDEVSAYSAGAVSEFPPVDSADCTSSQASTPIFGGNSKVDDKFGTELNSIVIRLIGLSERDDAWLRGKSRVAATGNIIGSGSDKPPLRALGLKITKDEDLTCLWFPKGRFSGGNVVAVTKKDNVTVNTREYTFSASETKKKYTFTDEITGASRTKGVSYVKGDTLDPAFDATDFFSQVQTPDTTGAPDALALSSIVPADVATDVAVNANVVLTFNNQILSGYAAVMEDDGTMVAAAQTWDDAGKVLTINPTSDMAAATLHIVTVAGFKDIYGQTLATATKTFTTA